MRQRQILFLARKFESFDLVRDEKKLDVHEKRVHRYEEIRRELETYGKVIRQRTSGMYPMAPRTENEGVDGTQQGKRLHENPDQHPSTLDAIHRKKEDARRIQQSLFQAVDSADIVIAILDNESDTRGSLIEYAHSRQKPILLLEQESVLQIPLRPLYAHRNGIAYHVFKTEEEMKRIIRQFFANFPAYAAG